MDFIERINSCFPNRFTMTKHWGKWKPTYLSVPHTCSNTLSFSILRKVKYLEYFLIMPLLYWTEKFELICKTTGHSEYFIWLSREPWRFTYHIKDRLQYEVYVDSGRTGPVVNRSNSAVIFPQEGSGQLVQSWSLWLLWHTFSQVD